MGKYVWAVSWFDELSMKQEMGSCTLAAKDDVTSILNTLHLEQFNRDEDSLQFMGSVKVLVDTIVNSINYKVIQVRDDRGHLLLVTAVKLGEEILIVVNNLHDVDLTDIEWWFSGLRDKKYNTIMMDDLQGNVNVVVYTGSVPPTKKELDDYLNE